MIKISLTSCMFTFSSSVNFGRVSLLPSACQVRILVYPRLNKLWPVTVNVSMPISNFIVVLIYLQSRANCRIQNGEKSTYIMPAYFSKFHKSYINIKHTVAIKCRVM